MGAEHVAIGTDPPFGWADEDRLAFSVTALTFAAERSS
jgi:hypothetical protein